MSKTEQSRWLAGPPAPPAGDPDLERRARVLRQGAAALLCCVPLYTAFLLLAGGGWSVPTLTVIGAGVVVLPVFPLARRRRHLTILGNAVVAILWAVLWLVGWHTGGVASPAMDWLAALPLVALLLAGWRSAIAWLVLAFVHAGVVYALTLGGVVFNNVLAPSGRFAFTVWGHGTLAVLLLALGAVYEAARRRAQQGERLQRDRLAASEAGFRTLIEHFPDALLVYQRGRIVYANPAAATLLGAGGPGELLDMAIEQIVEPTDRPAIAARVREALASGEAAPPREEWLVRTDGSRVLVEATAVPVTLHGQPTLLAFGRDIQEQKKLTARLMQMDRMIAAGTLAAGVAHEINNPLAYLSANLEDALRRVGELRAGATTAACAGGGGEASVLDEIAQALGDAADGSARIGKVVADLAVLSRGNEQPPGPVALAPVVASAAAIVDNQIRHRARLRIEIGALPPVEGDATHLGQVVLNLLINAAQAIDEGDAGGNEIAVRAETDGAWVVLAVSDTGCGMDEGVLGRIFDPFFTTKPMGQGTGLGLSICRSLLESFGGRLEVESAPGQGSTFRVWLKKSEQALLAPAAVPPSKRPAAAELPAVLVVDDEPLLGRALQRLLRGRARVTVGTSGVEVLALLEAGERYAVVFCDLMMPQMTGIELYEVLCQRYPAQAARVVFLTGGAFTPRAEKFLAETDRPLVSKPFDREQIVQVIDQLSARE